MSLIRNAASARLWLSRSVASSPGDCGTGCDQLRSSLPRRGGRRRGGQFHCDRAWSGYAARGRLAVRRPGAVRGASGSGPPAGPTPGSRRRGVPATRLRPAGSPGRVCRARAATRATSGRQPKTDTVYVPIQCRRLLPLLRQAGHVVDVINAVEMQRHDHVRVPGGRDDPGRQRPAGGCGRLSDRHHLCHQRQRRHRLGAERRPVQRPGDPRLPPPGGDGQGGEVPGRRGRQPGHAHAVCGQRRRRVASR